MKIVNKAFIPLLLALTGLGVVIFMLPFGVEAHQEEPNMGELSPQPQVLGGTDIQLSNGTNSRLPEIAASGSSAALVYEKGNLIYLRWAQTKWSNNKLLDTTKGGSPKIAFLPGTANTVHIVWAGYNGNSPQKAIRHIRCTMVTEPTINCGSITSIATTPFVTTTLSVPDLAIDMNGNLHVAWFENPTGGTPSIKTVRSISADNGTSWSTPANVPVIGGSNAGQPALASAGSFVHLIFREVSADNWQIKYQRSGIGADGWASVAGGGPFGEVLNYNKFSNPAIAAGNPKIFMAWDTQNFTTPELYGLIGVANTNSGNSGAWDVRRNITETFEVNGGVSPTARRSQNQAVPVTEDALRPSIALSGTNNFVIVWQERHDQNCGGGGGGIGSGSHLVANGTSEIYYAESQSDGWNTQVDTLSYDTTEYSIDPDIAVDGQGRTHIVFMKATNIGTGLECKDGGDTSDYEIYYRGPFTLKWPENFRYLPIIIK